MPDRDISLSLKARLALEREGFGYTHSLGQNFIFDEDLLERIAEHAGAFEGANVMEIGAGAGMLTCTMAKMGAHVVSLEIDKSLEPVLGRMLEDRSNVKLIFADAMKTDLGLLAETEFKGEDYVIAANLPYYITADFIMKCMSLSPMPKGITLMLQKEAAERVLSQCGDEKWGALAATVSYVCDGEKLMDVGRDMFTPPPHVDSALIKLTPKRNLNPPESEKQAFIGFIKAAFAMRRKTLVNNTSAAYRVSKQTFSQALASNGFDANVRGEALDMSQLAQVYELLKALQSN